MIHKYAIMSSSTGNFKKRIVNKAQTTQSFPQFPKFAHKLAESLSDVVLVDRVCPNINFTCHLGRNIY